MKTWESAEIIEMNIIETENGGKRSMSFDKEWFDENGARHVNFVPES